jgi:esterase/lipase superfamily enzyme
VKERTSWYSSRVERDVKLARWGSYGTPVLVFPTAGGDYEEIERFHLVDAVGELVEAGRVKVYSCDSVNGRVLLAQEGDAGRRTYLLNQFLEYVRWEVVPAIRVDCQSPGHRDHHVRRLDRRLQRARRSVPLAGCVSAPRSA